MSSIVVPMKNFCLDLHLKSILVSTERCIMTAPLSSGTLSINQTSRIGVLATMVDVAASDPVLAAWNPDWTATQDLSVHTMSPLVEGPIVVDAYLTRLGKRATFVSADIYDGHGLEDIVALQAAIDNKSTATPLTPAAKSLITFVRIPRSGASGVDTYNPNDWIGELKTRTSGIDNLDSLNSRLGIEMIDANLGIVEIANTPYVSNSIGTINGGVQAITMESAAEAMRPGMLAVDMQIHFMSQLKTGPARTRCTLIRETSDYSVIKVDLIDAGNQGKLLSTASITLNILD